VVVVCDGVEDVVLVVDVLVVEEVVPVGCEDGLLAGAGFPLRCDALPGAPCSCFARFGVRAGRPVCTEASSATPPWSVPRSPGWIGR